MIADCDSGQKRQISRPHRLMTIFLIFLFSFPLLLHVLLAADGNIVVSWGRRRISPRGKSWSGKRFKDLSQLMKSSDAAAALLLFILGSTNEAQDRDWNINKMNRFSSPRSSFARRRCVFCWFILFRSSARRKSYGCFIQSLPDRCCVFDAAASSSRPSSL